MGKIKKSDEPTITNEDLALQMKPRYVKVAVPSKNDSGLTIWENVAQEDFTPDHALALLNFWDELAKKDKVFNKDSAIDTTFDLVTE